MTSVKRSDLIEFLSNLPTDGDPEIVTGEEWLPEQLIAAHFNGELVNLTFNNAPEEDAGEIEGRGFVDHEITMLKDRIVRLLFDTTIESSAKADILLRILLLAHEESSAEVIEKLKDQRCWK